MPVYCFKSFCSWIMLNLMSLLSGNVLWYEKDTALYAKNFRIKIQGVEGLYIFTSLCEINYQMLMISKIRDVNS